MGPAAYHGAFVGTSNQLGDMGGLLQGLQEWLGAVVQLSLERPAGSELRGRPCVRQQQEPQEPRAHGDAAQVHCALVELQCLVRVVWNALKIVEATEIYWRRMGRGAEGVENPTVSSHSSKQSTWSKAENNWRDLRMRLLHPGSALGLG
jgi:hypothetical protein